MNIQLKIPYNANKYPSSRNSIGPIPRPNAGPGLWLGALLPLALTVNVLIHDVSRSYRTNTILSWMILVAQLPLLRKLGKLPRRQNASSKEPRRSFFMEAPSLIAVACGSVTSLVVGPLVIGQGLGASVFSGVVVTLMAESTLCALLRQLPKSFTVGEASVVAQGLSLFLFNCLGLDLPKSLLREGETTPSLEENISMIIQLGVLLIFILIGFLRALKTQRLHKIIPLTGLVLLGICTVPVTQPVPIQFVAEFLLGDLDRLLVLMFFGLWSLATVLICFWKVHSSNGPTSTSTRKLFHLVIVVVFLVGLLYQRHLLYLGSGIAFAVFLLSEALRVGKVDLVSPVLERTVKAFVDGQDAGLIALTPIYLLVGCVAPLFLSPVTFRSNRQAILPLLSGVLSVGIGDSFASVVGSRFGTHRWSGSKKSIEGTVANAASQLVACAVLLYTGLLPNWDTPFEYLVCLCGVLANAIIEAKTDQVDNLVTPLVTFIIFSLAGGGS